jgi:hypothetical protein
MRAVPSRLSLWAVVLTACWTVQSRADEGPNARGSIFPPSRALAGVRAYDDATIAALAQLTAEPELLAELRADPRRLAAPQAAAQAADPAHRKLLEQLSRAPEVVLIALEHPEAHAALGRALLETPEGAALRLAELRAAFDRAARDAAGDWQRALENDPVALGEYRELLTRFCHEQRMAWPDFPCVQVLDRSYYYACPPDEAILEYGMQRGLPPALQRVLTRFWKLHSPQAADARILRRAAAALSDSAGECLAAAAGETRRGMFSDTSTPSPVSVGLVPVMLQPLADRPERAREAFALAEHDRLWEAEPGPPGEPGGTFVVRDLNGTPPPEPVVADAAAPPPAPVATAPERQYIVRDQPGYVSATHMSDPGWWPDYVYGAGGLIWTDVGWGRPYLLPYTRYYYAGSYRKCRTRYFKNYGYPYGDWACRDTWRKEHREPPVYGRGQRVAPGGGWPVRNPQTSTGIGRIRSYPSAVLQVRPPDSAGPGPRSSLRGVLGGRDTPAADRAPVVRPSTPARRAGTMISPSRPVQQTRGAISPAQPVRPTVRSAPSPTRPPRAEIRRSQWPGARQAPAAPVRVRSSAGGGTRSR